MDTHKPTIIVDFDGVLHSYASGWKGADVIPDPPVDGAMEFLDEAVKHFRVAIFSSRSHQEGGIEAMKNWLDDHGASWDVQVLVEFPTVKPPAILSIDDRAICFNGTFPTMEFIKDFQPWNAQ
jgi:hypothetical protein